ncbi:MAG TPA: hypothetical protein VHV82_13220 [Sporichthyaceae bacterium]|nr:hypothetical protein [Sporichthyaceae bacterium]
MGRSRRLFGGYGPLLALAVAFLLVVTLVPTVARQQIVLAQAGAAPAVPLVGTTWPATASVPQAPGRAPKAAPGAAATPTGERLPHAVAVPAPRAASGPCADRRVQVVGDPYSPPCIAWPAGKDNGGATSSLGVTKDTIRVSFRHPVEEISDLFAVIRQLAGDKADKVPSFTTADVQRTIADYITYFNRNFQFYGRKIELVDWKGKGSILNEFQGAGQEAAQADAIKAAKELKVFADISALTQPYSDALARQQVVNIGAPYLSRQWFAAHAPYSWSPYPDCTSLGQTLAEYLNKRVFGRPADHAGPGVVGKPRKIGVVAPDNPEYQQCADAAEKIINAAGNKTQRYNYTLDLSRFSDQANNLAAKMKQDGITTIVLATDPILPLLLGARMSQQNYYPEWVILGAAFIDYDELGQLYDAAQWKHAFGISELGQEQPQGASFAYAAAKSVDPNHEPIFGADIFYNLIYPLAIGIQLAGPNLNPQSFLDGMRAYPGGTGLYGTWGYPDGAFSPQRDAREIWWDPGATSVANHAPGRWASTELRYKPGTWPTEPAAPQQLQLLAREPTTPPERR